MKITVDILKEIFVDPGHISEADFLSCVTEAKNDPHEVGKLIVKKGFVNSSNYTRAIADRFGYRFVSLKQESADELLLNLIPEDFARAKRAIIFNKNENGYKVAVENPEDKELIFLLEKKLGKEVSINVASSTDIDESLAKYQESLNVVFSRFLKKIDSPNLTQDEKDAKMIEMVDMLLWYGYQYRASDIHIEPYTKKILVRFRIDGILYDVLDIPRGMLDLILTRIKILSNLRIDEHQAPQDGKLTFRPSAISFLSESVRKSHENDPDLDIRISIMPVSGGENTVMRLLSAQGREKGMIELGLTEKDLIRAQQAIENPHGMILVTGPTGSGKSTTVYAMLQILNKRDVHISTIEDPIEYHVDGISQIQVNPKAFLTFANGLRSIVRQDPDIIMVGEIRDEETGGIAVNSALTGHLVLSTLHTNDAATTLPRLLDMKIEPFLVASTVRVIIAQRLVRQICPGCRISTSFGEHDIAVIENVPRVKAYFKKYLPKYYKDLKKVTVFKGMGCRICSQTGYVGRIGIFEVLEMNDEIKTLLLQRASSDAITEAAVKAGMTTLFDDGMKKVFDGITTFEEVIRVASA